MTRKLFAGASAVAVSAFAVTNAFAAGTTSGTSVVNTATVNYTVGSVAQTATGSDTFVVDRKIAFTVTETNSAATITANGAIAATTFTVSNTSNTVIDVNLAATEQVGGAGAHAGNTDNFNIGGTFTYYRDNGDGIFNSGTDTLITYIDELAADTSVQIHVVNTMPSSQVNGDVATVILTGTAQAGGGASALGAVLTNSGANTAGGVETVLAEGVGWSVTDTTGTPGSNGIYASRDDYRIAGLTLVKTSTVLWDPINGNTNPKAIPGAIVEYCIAITNGTGNPAATGVSINDPLPRVQPANTTQSIDYYQAPLPANALNGNAPPVETRFVNTSSGTCTSTGVTGTSTLTGTAGANNEVVNSGSMGTLNANSSMSFRFFGKVR